MLYIWGAHTGDPPPRVSRLLGRRTNMAVSANGLWSYYQDCSQYCSYCYYHHHHHHRCCCCYPLQPLSQTLLIPRCGTPPSAASLSKHIRDFGGGGRGGGG